MTLICISVHKCITDWLVWSLNPVVDILNLVVTGFFSLLLSKCNNSLILPLITNILYSTSLVFAFIELLFFIHFILYLLMCICVCLSVLIQTCMFYTAGEVRRQLVRTGSFLFHRSQGFKLIFSDLA